MKANIFFIMTGFLLYSLSCTNRVKDMSTDEKVQDFEFLYQTLKDNYPFFGITQRQYGVDWLANKDEYINRIKSTPNDSVYFFTLQSIIAKTGSVHLGILPTINHQLYTDTYKHGAIEKPKYQKWVDVLENKNKKLKYWQQICKNRWRKFYESNDTAVQNYTDSLLIDDHIAIMRFNKSFDYFDFTKDTTLINSFLDKIKDFNYLIIDIQDNSGGSANSWKRHIVGKMIASPVAFNRFQVIKDGALNHHFYPEAFEDGTIVRKNDSLPNIPDEILDGSFFLISGADTIMPNHSIPFNGKIFLLVNEVVASASEDFAYFCKISQWATVAGVRTMGDGNCGEPTLFRLPKSGIILTHPSVAGLNSDGSLNFEMRTVPDIPIEGKNPDERLNNLIKLIKK